MGVWRDEPPRSRTAVKTNRGVESEERSAGELEDILGDSSCTETYRYRRRETASPWLLCVMSLTGNNGMAVVLFFYEGVCVSVYIHLIMMVS